jgi:hypothetical protein
MARPLLTMVGALAMGACSVGCGGAELTFALMLDHFSTTGSLAGRSCAAPGEPPSTTFEGSVNIHDQGDPPTWLRNRFDGERDAIDVLVTAGEEPTGDGTTVLFQRSYEPAFAHARKVDQLLVPNGNLVYPIRVTGIGSDQTCPKPDFDEAADWL